MTDQIEKYFWILPLVLGSLAVTLSALPISVPLVLIKAIYISDYADFFLVGELGKYRKRGGYFHATQR
jgi:ABC-type phosphate transport system permease subunit